MMNKMMDYNVVLSTGNFSLFSLILSLVPLAATFFLFRKAGREGWEAIIPFYRTYTEFKLFWKPQMFAFMILTDILAVLGLITVVAANRPTFLVTTILGAVFAILGIVLRIIRVQKMAHAFEKRGWFSCGLFFFPLFFKLFLAFGKNQYVGANM